MAVLDLDLFTAAAYDYERSQYRILAALQRVHADYARNRIFPHLGELLELHRTLEALLKSGEELRQAQPGPIKEIDLEAGRVVHETPELEGEAVEALRELILWALPQLREAVEEGKTIFEFVDENVRLEEVGIVPSYLQEGYLLVPDPESETLHILQYSLSIFTSATERYRSLKTTQVRRLPQRATGAAPATVKLSLVEERRDLPNPATFYFAPSIDFPYEQTLLPVAKRKLMRHLFTRDRAA